MFVKVHQARIRLRTSSHLQVRREPSRARGTRVELTARALKHVTVDTVLGQTVLKDFGG